MRKSWKNISKIDNFYQQKKKIEMKKTNEKRRKIEKL